MQQLECLLAALGERLRDDAGGTASPMVEEALTMMLYNRLHTGSTVPHSGGADLAEALSAATPHRTTSRTVPLVRRYVGGAVVLLEGVLTEIPDRGPAHVGAATAAGDRVHITVPARRPRLSPGYLTVDSAVGPCRSDGPVLRVYLSVSAAAAAAGVWRDALSEANRVGLAYRAKVRTTSADYPRRDGVVLYLDPTWRPALNGLIAGLAAVRGLDPSTSLLASQVGPGVGVAWEPLDPRPGMRRMSFGQHRSRVIARTMATWARGQPGSRTDLRTALERELIDANVDPLDVSRNVDSPRLPLQDIRSSERNHHKKRRRNE